jgi:hypothetical protein
MPNRKQHKLPKLGATFERKWHDKLYRLKVIAQKDGKIAFEVAGDVFATPSGAAKSITKQEVNGWAFWRIDRD